MKIRIILADDHPVMIAGVKHELESVQTLDIVGTALNSSQVMALLSEHPCDVLITDYVMPGGSIGDGLGMLSYIRRHYPDLKVIVYTSINNPAVIGEVLRLGVQSVLNKADSIGHLITAIHTIHAGGTYRSQSSAVQEGGAGEERSDGLSKLSRRELEVVRLFVGGLSITEIARQLNRSKQTVSSQKASAMRKLGLSKDADLFEFSYESRLLAGSGSVARDEVEPS